MSGATKSSSDTPAGTAGVGAGLGILLLVLVWFCWGVSYPMTHIALEGFDVWTFRLLAMGPAGFLMLAIARLGGGRMVPPRRLWMPLTIAALLNMSIFQVGMTYGVDLMSSGRTAVIAYTMPLWAALFGVWLLRERLTRIRVLALALGLTGIAVLMSQDLSALENAPLGAATTLVAAIAFGAGTVWVKRYAWDIDVTALGGWQLVIGALPVALIWLLATPPTDWSAPGPASWAGAAYSMLIANVLAYAAWFRVVAVFPATVSGLGSLAVPVIGVFSSALIIGESVGWRELTALGLVCAALALVLFGPALMSARRRQ